MLLKCRNKPGQDRATETQFVAFGERLFILGIAFNIFLYKWYKRRKDLQLIEARYQLQLSEKEVAELKMHQQELELQNVHNALATSRQEATSFAVFLKSRNELLDKIRGMVKEGYKMDAQAITPHLKKINAFMSQRSQSGDKTNSALLTNIDDKSNEFLQRLVAIPSQTDTRRRNILPPC